MLNSIGIASIKASPKKKLPQTKNTEKNNDPISFKKMTNKANYCQN